MERALPVDDLEPAGEDIDGEEVGEAGADGTQDGEGVDVVAQEGKRDGGGNSVA